MRSSRTLPQFLLRSRRAYPGVGRLVGLIALLGIGHAEAENPGAPQAIIVEPSVVQLDGSRSTSQVLATGASIDGTLRDLTREVEWISLNPEVAEISPTGRIQPKGEGQTTIVARHASLESSVSVEVSGISRPDTVSFRNDVIPALSQAGCNMGACHGTPTGKGGLRLSLRGYLPDEDFFVLTREAGMRRIDTLAAGTSMLLRKPLGELPHEGGKRLDSNTKAFEFLHDWIAEGALDDQAAPKAVKLEILPGNRVLHEPARTQQVSARVTYADGSARDVTAICYYDSSNSDIAEVDSSGFVSFKRRGEVAIIAHYLDLVANVRLTHLVEVPGFAETTVPEGHVVDSAVFAKLNRMRVAPSEPCTDLEFVRRVYLDTVGLLPTPDEVEAFLANPSPNRREEVIDSLLNRPEFVDFWTLKFADILRSNSRLIEVKGAHAFHRWIRTNIENNTPIDEFVRQLVTAEGSTFNNPAANYYRISRNPEDSVETTAQLFLGVRIQCAKCHNHPFERWTQDDYYGFAAFFSRVRQKKGAVASEEIVYTTDSGEVTQPRTGAVMKPKALGGPEYDAGEADRRDLLAAWLTGPENPFFAKILVNRIWYHVMGRGIVEPVDDFRDSNPASNDELLDGLAAKFAADGFDLRNLVRTILTSQTYSLSARTNELNVDDDLYFSHAYTKLMPAEVLLDAISTVTGTTTAFTNLPAGVRAVEIPDGKMENPFLKTFGRPARELACECERESDSNLSQALQLIGGETVNDKLRAETGRAAQLAASERTPEEITRELYLVSLAREPDPSELAAAVEHFAKSSDRRQAIEDLGWVLINSKEFLFRH